MKKVIIFALLITLIPTTAHAEETGAWVAIDVEGNAVGQAIVCTQSVCGDPNGSFSKLTLGSNQRYVLQTLALPDGNVVGVGANQGMDFVKIDLQSGVWTTKQTNYEIDPITKKPAIDPVTQELIKHITVQQFTSETAPWVTRSKVSQIALIAQQETTIADLYAQLEKVKKLKKVKKAKK
jgi:hypothetical protein